MKIRQIYISPRTLSVPRSEHWFTEGEARGKLWALRRRLCPKSNGDYCVNYPSNIFRNSRMIFRIPGFNWVFSATWRVQIKILLLKRRDINNGHTMNPLNASVSASTIGIKSSMACLRGGISFLICESSASNFLFPYVSQPTMAARATPCSENTQDQQKNSPTSKTYIFICYDFTWESLVNWSASYWANTSNA